MEVVLLRLSLARKLVLYLFFGLVLFGAALSASLASSLARLNQNLAIVESAAAKTTQIMQLQLTSWQLIMPANDYLITADQGEREAFFETLSNLKRSVDNLRRENLSQEQRVALERANQGIDLVAGKAEKIFLLDPSAADFDLAAGATLMEEMDSAAEELIKNMGNLHALAKMEAEQAAANFRAAVGETRRNLFLAVGLALVLGVAFVGFFGSRIAGPVRRVTRLIADMATSGGDLTREVRIKTGDEVEDLAAAANKLVSGIRSMVLDIRAAAEKMTAASTDLLGMAETARRSGEEVARTIEEMARGGQSQAERSQDAAKFVLRLTDTVRDVTGYTSAVAGVAGAASGKARGGGELVQGIVRKMDALKGAVNNSAEAVRKLGERSAEIARIVEVITTISDQTNLLALNAAIEAARAGEQGRGFAVVAEEVRKLAEGSGKAAQEIADLIADTQADTDRAVEAMAEGTREVGEGVTLAGQAGEAFADILAAFQETVNKVEQVSQAVSALAGESDRLAAAMEAVAAVAQESAASTQEVSASTQEQATAMEEVSTAARGLSALADELRSLVGKFKV